MAVYTYLDTYIVNSVEEADLDTAETKALTDLGKQGVIDDFYLEELCKCLVYMDLSGKQLEAEGMTERAAFYRKEYLRLSQQNTFGHEDAGVFAGTIGRA